MAKASNILYIRGTEERDKLGQSITGQAMKLAQVLDYDSTTDYVKLQVIDHDDFQYVGSVLCTLNGYFEPVDTTLCDLLCD